VTLVHAIIGWVRGTGLMGGNDPLVAQVEAMGVRTWAPDEIAVELLGAATQEARLRAGDAPQALDLTGGLADVDLDLAELAGTREDAAGSPGTADAGQPADFADSVQATIDALPCPPEMRLHTTAPAWPEVTAAPRAPVTVAG